MSESPEATARRREHERELERLGVTTPDAQRLIDLWHRESRKSRLSERELFAGYKGVGK